jgi:hypothetical protein
MLCQAFTQAEQSYDRIDQALCYIEPQDRQRVYPFPPGKHICAEVDWSLSNEETEKGGTI